MTETASPSSPTPDVTRRLHRRRLSSAILLSLVVFVSGGAVGWGVAVLLGPRPPRGQGGPMQDPPVPAMVDRLREELLLTADQSKKVEEIYKTRFDALKKIREEMGPRMRAEYDGLRDQMKGILTPAQFDRWEQRFNSVRNRMLPPPRRQGPEGERAGPPENRPDGPPHPPQHPQLDGPPSGPADGPPDGPPNRRPPLGGPRDGPRPRNGPPPGGPAGLAAATSPTGPG